MLVRSVKACCPASQIDEYTPDAWHGLLSDLDMADCQEAVVAVAKRQPFIAASDIRAEVKRIRAGRLSRTTLPAPSPELADQPGRYAREIRAGIERIADARSIRNAIPAGEPLPGDPPPEWRDARKVIAEKSAVPAARDPRDVARQQVEAARTRRDREEGRSS
jgi:hypothetical protein